MKRILYAFLCIVISLFFSCTSEERKIAEVKQMIGRHIDFGNDYTIIPDSLSFSVQEMINGDTVVISYLDEISCTECTIKMLKKWHEFIKRIHPELQLLVVIKSNCNDEIKQLILNNELGPALLYENDNFKERNKLNVLAVNRTFLLNSESEIILVGEPYGNRKMMELYRYALNKQKE